MIKRGLFVIVAVTSFVLTVSTAWEFACFVSDFSADRYDQVIAVSRNVSAGGKAADAKKKSGSVTKTVWILLHNALLILLFMFAHTVLASRRIKRAFERVNILVIQRCVYNAVTSACLKVLISFWAMAFHYPLWIVDVKTSFVWWWVFFGIQCLAWFVVYSGCVMMDFAELMGLKQVYYNVRGFSDPMLYKSAELQRLYSHMRHPSFVGLCAALWLFPYMTLDRFLLALMLTVYMIAAFRVDQQDYVYQREQRMQKVYEVSHSTSHSYTYRHS